MAQTSAGFSPQCYPPRMTRAEALARRAAGTLKENCVVVITDGPTIGNIITGTSPTEIELNPTSPTSLGLTARVFTTFDDSAWSGLYDIDLGVAGSITRLTDNLGNTAQDIDADSPTVHTQFPWGATNWRDNYVEDVPTITPVAGATNPIVGNRIVNSNVLDLTGLTNNLFNGISHCEFVNAGTLHIQGGSTWTRSKVYGSTVNCVGGGRINMTEATLQGNSNVINNATVDARAITISRSILNTSNITENSDVAGSISVTDSFLASSSLTIDAGAFKSIGISNGSSITQTQIHCAGGTVLRSCNISATELSSFAGGNEIDHIGDCPISISRSFVTIANTWVIEGSGSSGLNILDSTLQRCRFTKGPDSQRTEVSSVVLSQCGIIHNGSGDINLERTQGSLAVIDTQTGSTGPLDLGGSLFRGGGTITMLPACTRESQFLSCEFTQFSTVTLSCTGTPPLGGDRYDQLRLLAGDFINSAAGGTDNYIVVRTTIQGTALAGDGVLTISGNSPGVQIDDCEIHGVVTIHDAPGLTNPDSFHGNYVGSAASILYTGGDATIKKLRENYVEGEGSALICTNLTGSAGLALGDVIRNRITGQSSMIVDGARVVGFPIRNNEVRSGSTLTIPANGSVLQLEVSRNFDLDTGAFTHFDSEFSGNFAQTLTAANLNTMHTVAFDNSI